MMPQISVSYGSGKRINLVMGDSLSAIRNGSGSSTTADSAGRWGSYGIPSWVYFTGQPISVFYDTAIAGNPIQYQTEKIWGPGFNHADRGWPIYPKNWLSKFKRAFLFCGVNNIILGDDVVSLIQPRINALVDPFYTYGVELYIMGIAPWSSSTPGYGNLTAAAGRQKRVDINSYYLSKATAYWGADHYLDMDWMGDGTGTSCFLKTIYNLGDGVHFTQAATQAIGAYVAPYILDS
jgi:hypothetical protein